MVPAAVGGGASRRGRPEDPRARFSWLLAPAESGRRVGRGPAVVPWTRAVGGARARARRPRPPWALLALLAAGERDSAARAARGVEPGWRETQLPDPARGMSREYTGTGFPGDFYINYHLYRLVFPLQALGRFVYGWKPAERP